MFELIIILSRYLFLLHIIFFLYQCVIYGHGGTVGAHISLRQRVSIILFIIAAYAIITYKLYLTPYENSVYGTATYLDALKTGAATLLFFVFAFISSEIIYGNADRIMLNCVFFLMSVGIVTLERLNPFLAARQLVWFCIGYVVSLFIPFVLNFLPRLYKFWMVYLAVGLTLLISTFFVGVEYSGAVRQWIINGVSVQPSELVKFFFVFYLASVLKDNLTLKQLILPALFAAVFVICLVLQTDLGSALIFFITFMVVMYVSTSKEYLFFAGMFFASMASCLAYHLFRHVRVRVAAWQNPWADPSGGGYQIIQSLYAVGTWGFWGSGLTRGMPHRIPVVERDFIFSAICEEFGSLFGICVIIIFAVILYRGLQIPMRSAAKSDDINARFFALLSIGFTSMLSFQAFLIIGGCIKLIPLTGVTLPFVSYGGSSVTVSLFMIGILQWIKSREYA